MFVNKNGVVKLLKPFPKRMTWKRALELSIKKWEFILLEIMNENRVSVCGGSDTCALCYRADDRCLKCPIGKKVNNSCHATPWENVITSGFTKETIEAEIDFLKSL